MKTSISLRLGTLSKLNTLLISALIAALLTTVCALAETPAAANSSAKARLGDLRILSSQDLLVSPRSMPGGSVITLVSPSALKPLADSLEDELSSVHSSMMEYFGSIPRFSVSIRLMEEETFFKTTKAPRWTNAMFHRGQITIPVTPGEKIDNEILGRAATHEYTHAIINALSGGACPGWLDEGLAQWAEGEQNPALQPALLRWLGKHPPISLSLLQGGFTRLDQSMVPAAYAQALYATNTLINTYGFAEITHFMRLLKAKQTQEQAFQKAFRLSLSDFEKALRTSMRRWYGRHHDG